jgi:putative ABC transport system permease protein
MRPEAPSRHQQSVLERVAACLRPALTTRMALRNLERQPGRAAMSVIGISFAVGSLLVGLSFIDVVAALVEEQFTRVMRQDATLALVQPRGRSVLYDVRHLPGVLDAEPMRVVPIRLSAGPRARTIALTGLDASPRLNRVVDIRGRALDVLPDGLVISRALGEVLHIRAGDAVHVEVLEGRRRTRSLVVSRLIDDALGLNAYIRTDELRTLLGEGDTLSAVAVTVDAAEEHRFHAAVKTVPAIAAVALQSATLQNFRDTMAANMNLQIAVNVMFAAVIAFGVIYNAARVSLSERSRELASLRVLGFTRREISGILLGELAVLTAAALPVGLGLGYLLGLLIVNAFNTELYRMSYILLPSTVGWTWLTVIVAAAASALIVRRRLDRLDLVAVLKAQE